MVNNHGHQFDLGILCLDDMNVVSSQSGEAAVLSHFWLLTSNLKGCSPLADSSSPLADSGDPALVKVRHPFLNILGDCRAGGTVPVSRGFDVTRPFPLAPGPWGLGLWPVVMTELKDDLAALRIEREPERRRRGGGKALTWIIVLLVLGAGGYGAWRWTTAARPIEVETAKVTERAAGAQAAVLNASGYVTARRRATVSSKVTGKVVEVNVEEGMAVREGQVLARLDDAAVQAALALAEAQARSREAHGARERSAARRSAGDAQAADDARQGRIRHAGRGRRGEGDDRFERRAHLRRSRAGERGRAAGRARTDEPRQHDHPRAVQRRRDLEGRAAGRDGLAGLGRRRLHAHGHLHDRRHALARDRSGRQRELHQPRQVRIRA